MQFTYFWTEPQDDGYGAVHQYLVLRNLIFHQIYIPFVDPRSPCARGGLLLGGGSRSASAATAAAGLLWIGAAGHIATLV